MRRWGAALLARLLLLLLWTAPARASRVLSGVNEGLEFSSLPRTRFLGPPAFALNTSAAAPRGLLRHAKGLDDFCTPKRVAPAVAAAAAAAAGPTGATATPPRWSAAADASADAAAATDEEPLDWRGHVVVLYWHGLQVRERINDCEPTHDVRSSPSAVGEESVGLERPGCARGRATPDHTSLSDPARALSRFRTCPNGITPTHQWTAVDLCDPNGARCLARFKLALNRTLLSGGGGGVGVCARRVAAKRVGSTHLESEQHARLRSGRHDELDLHA